MRRAAARRRLAAAVAAVSLCALLTPGTGLAGAVRTRTYAAFLSGTGALASQHARLAVTLTLTPAGSPPAPAPRPPLAAQPPLAVYAVTITLHAESCRRTAAHTARGCLLVSGSLRGYAVEDPRNPPIADFPPRVKLTPLSGTLRGLGAATARGEMLGTGFIRRGRRTLELVIRTGRRQYDLSGAGPLLPGFQAP